MDIGAYFGPTPAYLQMKLVGGIPAVAYLDFYPIEAAWYCAADTGDGGTWGDPIPLNLNPSDGAGSYINLLVNDGRPSAVYNLSGTDQIQIAQARYE